MTRRKPVEWLKLDNAAKIFPPNTSEKDTKVFRFVCELREEIEKDTLQKALDKALPMFPVYQSVLRRGMFWYYFDSTDAWPEVVEERKLPCSMLFRQNRRNLLFEVSYYNRRINLEMYHALTDGTGALGFLKTIVYYYLIIKHEQDFKEGLPKLDYDASFTQKMDDSFLKHYSGDKTLDKIKLRRAYRISGRRSIDNRLKIVEGVMSVKEVLNLAHDHDTTLTVYLTALYMKAIHMDMPTRSRKYPVILTVPVNLRSYFPSVTARNFFATVSVSYDFAKSSDKLEDIIVAVKEAFARELTEEKLRNHINRLSALEHNVFMRVIPLVIKDGILRFATFLSDRGITATLSNIGKISVTKELAPYIHLFDCFTSARRPQIAMCSFGDELVISFTSPYVGTDIQKNFFRMLTQDGVAVSIASNNKEN
ncbi:MAG: hypothetical protein K0R34_2281 [Herbinix sp.]|jgi:NRPS condensation-like uncharacterized protein|nr:hypothetical protein [Herbinix sp.]